MKLLNPEFEMSLLSRIEDAGLNASAPPQQRWLDGWMVRYSPGKAKRARCVNALAGGRTSMAARIAACARLYGEVNLPLIFRLTPFSLPSDIDQTLNDAGFRRFDDTRVMVLRQIGEAPAAPARGITVDPVGLEAFAQRVGAFRGSSLAVRQAHAERLLNAPVSFFAFEMRENGAPVACGQYAMEDDLVGLYDVHTAEPHRGRGMARTLCAHLLATARDRGARRAYLQVESDNHAARAVYHGLGFQDGYAYHYRATDPAAA